MERPFFEVCRDGEIATVAYEPNMADRFDAVTKSVLIGFRDEFVTLPGPFFDRRTAVAAGEAYCKSLG